MKTFEAWWNKSGDKAGDNKEIERRAFLAGQMRGLSADDRYLIANAAAVGATREYFVGAKLRRLRRLLRYISE